MLAQSDLKSTNCAQKPAKLPANICEELDIPKLEQNEVIGEAIKNQGGHNGRAAVSITIKNAQGSAVSHTDYTAITAARASIEMMSREACLDGVTSILGNVGRRLRMEGKL